MKDKELIGYAIQTIEYLDRKKEKLLGDKTLNTINVTLARLNRMMKESDSQELRSQMQNYIDEIEERMDLYYQNHSDDSNNKYHNDYLELRKNVTTSIEKERESSIEKLRRKLRGKIETSETASSTGLTPRTISRDNNLNYREKHADGQHDEPTDSESLYQIGEKETIGFINKLGAAEEDHSLNDTCEWSDDSGDESYGVIGETTRLEQKKPAISGNYSIDSFSVTPSTLKKSRPTGSRIITTLLVKLLIDPLSNENYKTLHHTFYKIIESIYPECSTNKDIKDKYDSLIVALRHSRAARKTSSAALRQQRLSIQRENNKEAEEVLRRKEEYIRRDKHNIYFFIKEVADIVIDHIERENYDMRVRRKVNRGESYALHRLITIDRFFLDIKNNTVNSCLLPSDRPRRILVAETQEYFSSNSVVGNNSRGSAFASLLGKTYNNTTAMDLRKSLMHLKDYFSSTSLLDDNLQNIVLNNIGKNMEKLLDYPKLFDVENHLQIVQGQRDDREDLYKSLAKLTVLSFNIFKGIASLPKGSKEIIYDSLLSNVLENQMWGVSREGMKDELDLESLKEGVSKYATIEFGQDEFNMKISLDAKLNFRAVRDAINDAVTVNINKSDTLNTNTPARSRANISGSTPESPSHESWTEKRKKNQSIESGGQQFKGHSPK